MAQQRQPYILDPFVPQSPLQQRYSSHIYSPVQGFAELAGNLGEVYLRGRQAKKEEKEQEEYARQLAQIYSLAQDPGLAKDGKTGALYSEQDFNGLQTQGINPMSWQQRGQEAVGRLTSVNPRLAAQSMGGIMDAAQGAQPPPKWNNFDLDNGGRGQRNELTGEERVIVQPRQPVQDPAEMQVALWVNGGDEKKAQAWLRGIKTPKATTNEAPSGYRFNPDGSLAAIPGGPADKKETQAPPQGYRFTSDGTALEPIPGGPAEIGQKGLPQKYKDAKTAITQMRGTLKEYKDLIGETGTEYWNAAKAARLGTLQTQMTFGIKGLEQTGALDRGSVEVMGGMLPDANSLGANINPWGGAKARAKLDELEKYVARTEAALDTSYGAQGGGVPPGVDPDIWAAMTPEDKELFQ